MKNKRIAVIGSLNYDIILKQERLPEVGETFTADSLNMCCGGKGANQAAQVAKLGGEVVMIGTVGDDCFGDELIYNLKRLGVNIDYIRKSKKNPTGMGVVNTVGDGKVAATISKGANYDMTVDYIDSVKDIIKNSEIIILQLEIPMEIIEYVINLSYENGNYIILNAAPASPVKSDVMKKVDCLIVNEVEADFYLGMSNNGVYSKEDCKTLFEKIKDLLIITLGEKGSLVYDGKEMKKVESYKVKAVETTGAGDSFTGAFAYKLLTGSSYLEAVKFSSKVSALTVTKIGAQDSMPTNDQVEEYFKK